MAPKYDCKTENDKAMRPRRTFVFSAVLLFLTGLSVSVKRVTYVNYRTYEQRTLDRTWFCPGRMKRLDRADGWIPVESSCPWFPLENRFGGCRGYHEGHVFVWAANRIKNDGLFGNNCERALRTLSSLADDCGRFGPGYYEPFALKTDDWYSSLFVLNTHVGTRRDDDGESVAVWRVENHSGVDQTSRSVRFVGAHDGARLFWAHVGKEDWRPMDFPFVFPSDGELPGVSLLFRFTFPTNAAECETCQEVHLNVTGRGTMIPLRARSCP